MNPAVVLAILVTGVSVGSALAMIALARGWKRARNRGNALAAPDDRTAEPLENLMSSLPVAVLLMDPNGRIVRCIGGALGALGHDPRDAIGLNVHDHTYRNQPVVQLARQLIACVRPDAELVVQGRTFEVLPLPDAGDWDGNTVHAVVDVTRRAEAGQESKRLRQIITSLVESMPHAIAMLEVQPDGQYAYTFANRAFAAHVGHELDLVVGNTPEAILGPTQLAGFERQQARAIRMRQPVRFEARGGGWPQAGAIISTTLVPLFSDASVCTSIVHVARDVSVERYGLAAG